MHAEHSTRQLIRVSFFLFISFAEPAEWLGGCYRHDYACKGQIGTCTQCDTFRLDCSGGNECNDPAGRVCCWVSVSLCLSVFVIVIFNLILSISVGLDSSGRNECNDHTGCVCCWVSLCFFIDYYLYFTLLSEQVSVRLLAHMYQHSHKHTCTDTHVCTHTHTHRYAYKRYLLGGREQQLSYVVKQRNSHRAR